MTAVGVVTILVAAGYAMVDIARITHRLLAVWSAGDAQPPHQRGEASEGAEHCDQVG